MYLKRLKIRDALREDREAVLEFCRNTWPGYGDYIARAWQRWIRDSSGRFLVAELNGRAVGIAKIDDFGGGEVWLEGLRVDPGFRRKGIGNAINKEVVRTLRRMKPRSVRFCTAVSNRASRSIGEHFGFALKTRFRYYWQRTRRGKPAGERACRSQSADIYGYMLQSRFLRLSSGLVGEGWVFRELKPEILDAYIKEGRVWITIRRGLLSGVAVYSEELAEGTINLGFIHGEPGPMRTLMKNCMYIAGQRGDRYCSAAVPTRYYARELEKAGYERKESIGQVVYEYMGPHR
jgi:ribosomal protein S18 acetylase RimI-like enzyme